MEAYFDNAATTVVYPEVRELMVKLMSDDYGNPSSLHMMGLQAENYIKDATRSLAKELKCRESEIVYTSGGTESNNMAIIGSALAKRRAGKHIITTKIEHASVSATMEFLKKEGFEISYLDVNSDGVISIEDLKDTLREDTILVSVMYVNNEIGSIMPIKDISATVKEFNENILVHVDAIQAFGKIKLSPKDLGVDLLSISGHKFHGPKGSGILYVKDKVLLRPIIYGGGQQKAMRSGTENVPAIAGLALAAKLMLEDHEKKIEHIKKLRDTFIEKVTEIENVYDNSKGAPHIASISFVGIRSEVMLHALEERNIYVSAGSACSSNKQQVSGTLKAIGLDKDGLDSTLRFSFSELNTMEEIDYTVGIIKEILPVFRRYIRK